MNEDFFNRFMELLEKSEARIDRTNEMVVRFSDASTAATETTRMLIAEYAKRIDALAECRDAVLEQNKILLSIVDRLTGHTHTGNIKIDNNF